MINAEEIYQEKKHWLSRPIGLLIIAGIAVAFSLKIGKGDMLMAIIGILLSFVMIYLIKVFVNPELALKTAFIVQFFAVGITRYAPAPMGLSIDALLILTWLAILFKGGKKVNWKLVRHPLSAFMLVWMGYTVLEIVNPESVSIVAWFYSMRGVSLYMLLVIPLTFLVFNQRRHLQWFLHTWFIISLLAALKGYGQLYGGLDSAEQAWIDAGAYVTHILFGHLRVFSFYSDAGQFGAAMANVTVTAFIMMSGPFPKKRKIFYGIVGIVCLWGFFISGTRGAFAVLASGGMMYLALTKNIKLMVVGAAMGAGVFVFLAHTQIMNGNYEIRRLRDAIQSGSENASLQVRLENQRKLKVYLASRPFGGGVGSAGDWGKRFSPNSVLAQTPTDSWYVRIWAEMGIVGLTLYAIMWLYVLIFGFLIIWKIKEQMLRTQLMAIYGGLVGILAASYANSVVAQFPTALISYMGVCFIFMGKHWEEKGEYPHYINENHTTIRI